MSSQVITNQVRAASPADLPRGRPGGLLLLLLSVILLGFVIPAFFLSGSAGSLSSNVSLALVIVGWTTLRLAYTAASGERRLTLLCFYIFVYVFMGVQPLMSAWTGRFPHRPELTEPWMMRTFLLTILGIAAFEAAYLAGKRKRREPARVAVVSAVMLPRPVVLSTLWMTFAAALILVAAALETYGNIFLGIRGAVLRQAEGPSLSQTEGLLVISGLRGLLAAQLFISVFLWTRRRHYDWSRSDIRQLRWMLILQALVNFLISNPLSTARLWSGCIILTILFMATPWRGSRTFLVWSTGACLAFLGLFSAIDPRVIIAGPLLRGEPIGIASTMRVMRMALGNFQIDANFDAFQMLGLISRYADEVGFSMGYQLLLPLLFWVPRSFWPGKPLGTPDIVAASLGFFSINVGSPLWAEGYINFGIFGVVLLMGVLGLSSRLCDDHLVRSTREPAGLLPTIATCFFASNTIILLRGDITSGTMYLQMVLAFTAFIAFVIKRQNRRVASRDVRR